ncbi:MAG: hypothetical protein ACRDQH_01445 [Pseudonocardiaceae bacterium]
MSELLGREQILGAEDLETKDVEVPEWGGTVRVRGLSAGERDRHEMRMALAQRDGVLTDVRASVVASAIIDENGKRVFSDAEIMVLSKKSADALDRLFDVVSKLSGMTEEKLREAVQAFLQSRANGSPSA